MPYGCRECGSNNNVIIYNHSHGVPGWTATRSGNDPGINEQADGLPTPIPCPDGLVHSFGGEKLQDEIAKAVLSKYGALPAGCSAPPTQNVVPASSMFCYDCGTNLVFGPPPLYGDA